MSIRFGFVSTYPPTLCGLATFTASLRAELVPAGIENRIVRVVDAPTGNRPADVVAELVAGDRASAVAAAQGLAGNDVVIVQHEYGIYGGADGREVLDLLSALTVPAVVVLHTVLAHPTPHQRLVLEEVTRLAQAVVVMTQTAWDRLAAAFDVDMSKVSLIPHGAPSLRTGHAPTFRSVEPMILTWGLIGPGKGLEWAISAMARLTDLHPRPRYVIAGQTHPKVLAREGEAYRGRLQRQVRELGLADTVTFDGHYRHTAALAELIDTADVVLLPYDSTEQATSGVLSEAVAAGKPVVATRFPHAVELLGAGAGMVVPHRDPAAIAGAIRTLMTHHDVGAGIRRAAAAGTPELLWPAVGRRYYDLAEVLVKSGLAA